MDAAPFNAIIISLVFAALALYALYFVIRAGVRDGILQADKKRGSTSAQASGSGRLNP